MDSDPVLRLFTSGQEAQRLLESNREFSYAVELHDFARKSLLLAGASAFERRISKAVESFAARVSGNHNELCALVTARVIQRQYHTYFDWNTENTNKFYGMFGADFRTACLKTIRENDLLEDAAKAFMQLGTKRNQLVHQDFAVFNLDWTSADIWNKYLSADQFVTWIEVMLTDGENGDVAWKRVRERTQAETAQNE